MTTVAKRYFQSVNKNEDVFQNDNLPAKLNKSKARVLERETEKLYLTLDRENDCQGWGFSCNAGDDLEQWGGLLSGVVVGRHEKGLWLGVASVRDETPAKKSGMKPGDFITSINGRIVFHLSPPDISRLIRNSGKVLYLDIERRSSKTLLYCNGLHQYSYNFLFDDNWEMKKNHF